MISVVPIHLEGISKHFELVREGKPGRLSFTKQEVREPLTALNDVSFTVEKGECLGIIGENGSGKSTLLRIIAGIYAPSEGKVDVKGRVIPFIELGSGFQGELTGRENVYLYGTLLGLTRGEVERNFDRIVDFSGLSEFIDTRFASYSSGMKVRLAFSTAMVYDPDILLLDEVLSVGDEDFQKKSVNKIKEFKLHGKTICFVSHGMNDIRKICDRVIVLNQGNMIFQGAVEEGIGHYLNLVFEKHRDSLKWGIEEKRERLTSLEADLAALEGRKKGKRKSRKQDREHQALNDQIGMVRIELSELFEQALKIEEDRSTLGKEKVSLTSSEEINEELEDIFTMALDYGDDVVSQKKVLSNLEPLLFEQFSKGQIEKDLDQQIRSLEKLKTVLFRQFEAYEDEKIRRLICTDYLTIASSIDLVEVTDQLSSEQIFAHVREMVQFLTDKIDPLGVDHIREDGYKKVDHYIAHHIYANQSLGLDLKIEIYGLLQEQFGDFPRERFEILSHGFITNSVKQAITSSILKLEERLFEIREQREHLRRDALESPEGRAAKKCEKISAEIAEIESEQAELHKKYEELFHVPGQEKAGAQIGGESDCVLCGIRFLNGSGEETSTFSTGDKFVAEISYDARRPIERPMFGIAVHSPDGHLLFGPNTTFAGKNIDRIEGHGRVLFVVDSLPLLSGVYRVSLSVGDHSGTHIFDYKDKLYHFKVTNKSSTDEYGIVHIRSDWKYED